MANRSYQDKFIDHVKNPDRHPLTEKEQQVWDRWWEINNMIRSGKTRSTIVALIRKIHPNISQATVYNDLKDAMGFFGSFEKPNKEYLRQVLYDLTMDTLMKAKAKNDLMAETKAEAVLVKITGVDKESPEIPDFSKFEGNKYTITLVMDGTAKILDLENPGGIPKELLKQMMDALAPAELSKQDMLKMLDTASDNEIIDIEGEEI